MADETNTIEELIADMRHRIRRMPRVIPVLESLLEHLKHADVTEADHEEIVKWLHFAVRSPRMAELVYCMARLVTQRDPKKPAVPSMRN